MVTALDAQLIDEPAVLHDPAWQQAISDEFYRVLLGATWLGDEPEARDEFFLGLLSYATGVVDRDPVLLDRGRDGAASLLRYCTRWVGDHTEYERRYAMTPTAA